VINHTVFQTGLFARSETPSTEHPRHWKHHHLH